MTGSAISSVWDRNVSSKQWKKPWSTKRRPDLAGDLNLLIGDLASQWGLLSRTLWGADLVRDFPTLTPDIFAREVLSQCGLNPEYEIDKYRRIRRLFLDRYGDAVSESTFVSPCS
jgi:hypothetical protein